MQPYSLGYITTTRGDKVKSLIFNYSNLLFAILLSFFIISLTFIALSGQNFLTPKQHRRIAKLRMTTLEPKKKSNKYSPNILLKNLICSAGFEENIKQVFDAFKIFALVTFIFALLLSFMLGFPVIGSIIFASISTIFSPVIPMLILTYLRTTRNSLITEEIFIVMTHIIDAVQAAGKTLQGGLEDALYAAPILRPYLRRFLNTFLTIGLTEAIEKLRETIQLEEMELFLDLISHGFEHTTQELTRYFQSESDAYHELEIASKQRRMERREVLFDVLVVFPFILGFALMIYPVFMQGMAAINHTM